MKPLTGPAPKKLQLADLARIASIGVRTRRLRAGLSALGIAIGVAAIVAVLGLSASSQAGLLAEIDRLGTNLLTVTTGQTLSGDTAELPIAAPGMIARIGPVTQVADTGSMTASVYRSPLIPSAETGALSVQAATLTLLPVVGATVTRGVYLNAATEREPVAVLGAAAAQRLGIDQVYAGERIWLGGQWFYVAGILSSAVLAPEIDSSVLIGFPAAKTYLGFDGHPTTIYLRSVTSQVTAVQSVLAATANPEAPNEVDVSQPSAVLTARAAAQGALNGLFLGLGAVSLLVGAVGVANIMLISVLERRSEIGLRRALGATKGHIRTQFLSEAILLALLGGAVGVTLGVLATALYAHTKHWTTVIPTLAWAGGLAAAIAIGAIAGLLPAIRAARLSPTDALRTL
ncbi:MAG TPA: ABC transporter permease [Gaiellales bacterium]|nr:ABC transporter permease [Gaiellales bacterium]